MKHIAIMGLGMVGGNLGKFFASEGIEADRYDPPKGFPDPSVLGRADVIFIAVPTPFYMDGRGFDVSFLHEAIRAIPGSGKAVVIKSTVIPGTTDAMQKDYPQHRFLFNPEFLTEQRAEWDTFHPERQIVGYTDASKDDAESVLRMLPKAGFQRIIPAKAAELVKYFGNAFYALKVTYANQMHDLCERLGLDYDHILDCVGAEPWIGRQHLVVKHRGYRGYGGKCLPKDTRALLELAKETGIDLTLLTAAEVYNNALLASQGIDFAWKEGSPEKGDQKSE
jgi:UDPglucose 6-dehydrogenase